MRALRVVGLTEDGEVVLEDPVRLERFRVPADERLRAAARGDLSRLGQIAIELESQLRPREIQARIRAGASVDQVAAAAGVPEQKIERFAYPVLLERFRTAENAQRAHPVRADGPDNRTLAEVVAHTFGLRGQEYEGARWDSWKGEDGRWVVALSWRAGRSDNRAHWTFQPGAHGGTVTALDEHASDLVEGLPARPLRTVGAVVDMARPEEEPAPTPSPVEQWRAAASDSYRERMPHAPESGRPGGERGATRTSEPWRPGAPAPRQPEPAEARTAEPRGAYRGSDARAVEPREPRVTAEWSGDRGTASPAAPRRAPVVPEQGRPERPGEPSLAEQPLAEQARSERVPTPDDAGGVATDAGAPVVDAPTRATEAEPASRTPAVEEPAAADSAAAVETPAGTESPAAQIPATAGTSTGDGQAVEGDGAEAPAAESPAAQPPAAGTPAESQAAGRRTKKGKPVMPSWDEVLLGVRGPR
jgi:Protein of unknown function (DUF3071)